MARFCGIYDHCPVRKYFRRFVRKITNKPAPINPATRDYAIGPFDLPDDVWATVESREVRIVAKDPWAIQRGIQYHYPHCRRAEKLKFLQLRSTSDEDAPLCTL